MLQAKKTKFKLKKKAMLQAKKNTYKKTYWHEKCSMNPVSSLPCAKSMWL